MIRKAYILHREDYPESTSSFSAYEGFRRLGVETAPIYGFGDTPDDLGPEVMVVGGISEVWSALDKLGRPCPESLDYPEELNNIGRFPERHIQPSTLESVRTMTGPAFVKPQTQKLFTGFVWNQTKADRLRIACYGDKTRVWVMSVVNFLAEYRCYVLDGEILGVHGYKGDWSLAPNLVTVHQAVKAFKSAPRSYAIDFGIVLSPHIGDETIIVEVNDSYALGNYGLRPEPYAKMLMARWEELVGD